MFRAAFSLEQIEVASPCSASWEAMRGDERVRHCQQCGLNVYNLSAMGREEAEALVRGTEGRLCVRFHRRADGTFLTQDCPRGLRAPRRAGRGVRTFVAAGLAVVLAVLFAWLGWLRSDPNQAAEARRLRDIKPFKPVFEWLDPSPPPPPPMVMGKMCIPLPGDRE